MTSKRNRICLECGKPSWGKRCKECGNTKDYGALSRSYGRRKKRQRQGQDIMKKECINCGKKAKLDLYGLCRECEDKSNVLSLARQGQFNTLKWK